MNEFEKYQRTSELLKEDILTENRLLKRQIAEKDQSFELVKFVHFDKTIDLDKLNDIIIGCTGCLYSMMFYKERVITNLNEEDYIYKSIMSNMKKISNKAELLVLYDLIADYTVVIHPVSSSDMLVDSKAFVKRIIMIYPNDKMDDYLLSFVKSFMIVNEVLVNIVLTREKMIDLIELDPLTEVLNRASWNSSLKQIIDEQKPFFVLMLDVDKFKEVNDTYGHSVGDDILKLTSEWLKSNFRGEDKVFRLGGDEFAVTGRINMEFKDRLIEKFENLNNEFKVKAKKDLNVDTSISIGAYVAKNPINEVDVYAKTDALLYESKVNGRDCISISEDWL
ncbi:MAG: GGDEF domain-containing protein [Acidaminobacteraceae bacterium]